MIQMTTPDLIFNVDVDLTGADEISITFRQNGSNVLILDKDRLDVESDKITVTFSQAESGRFATGKVLMQIKALVGGKVISHPNPVETTVYRIYDRRVFGDGV